MIDMRIILKKLMELHGDDAYSLEAKSGVPQPTTQRFLSGKHGEPRSSTVRKWATAYGLKESDLRGDGDPQNLNGLLLYPNEADAAELGEPINLEGLLVHEYENIKPAAKLLSFARNPDYKSTGIDVDAGSIKIKQYLDVGGSMGRGVQLEDQPGQITSWEVTQEWLTKNIPSNTGANNLCIITGFGNSMKGMFNPGDPLVVDIGVRECKHDGVYFFRVENEGFVKMLQRIPGQGIRVISKNADYEAWTITEDMDFEVLGKVLKIWESSEF